MEIDLIVWGAMAVFGVFIFLKIKKIFFKNKRKRQENEPKISSKQYWKDAFNQFKEPEKRREIIKTVVKNIPQPPPQTEPNYEKEESKKEKTDSFSKTVKDNDDIARNIFGTYDFSYNKKDSNYEDMWEDILDQNTNFANEMFGYGKKSKKKKRRKDNDEDYW